VQTHRVGDDLDDAPVAELVAVAERAVDDVPAPVLGEALDVGQLVDQTGGGENPSGDTVWPPTSSTRKRSSSVRVTSTARPSMTSPP
jgi:hypothetical protein